MTESKRASLKCIEMSIQVHILKAHYWMANAPLETSTTAAQESIKRAKAFVELANEATEEYKQLIHTL